MSDDEDDYLSDKFLARLEEAPKPQQPESYIERRKQALKQSQLLNERNRKKGRKQMELEAREEGLQTNLIQKAQEEAKESGKQNKALAIMMKMGFKPGQGLGESYEESLSSSSIGGNFGSPRPAETSGVAGERDAEAETSTPPSEPRTSALATYKHRAEPLPIKEWSGKPPSSSLATCLIPDLHLPLLLLFKIRVTNSQIYKPFSINHHRQDWYRRSETTPFPEHARTCGQNGQTIPSPKRRGVPGSCTERVRRSESGRHVEKCEDYVRQSRHEG